MLEKHVASVALAKLRYNVIHKVSGMTPTVKVTNIKRENELLKDQPMINLPCELNGYMVRYNSTLGLITTKM